MHDAITLKGIKNADAQCYKKNKRILKSKRGEKEPVVRCTETTYW